MAAFNPNEVYNTGGTGDPTLASNWSGDGLSDGDEAAIRDTAINIAAAGADQSGIDLDILHIWPTYTGSIGSDGSPWRINAETLHFESGGAEAFIDGNFADVYVDSKSKGANALVLNASNSGSISRVHLMRGNVEIGTLCNVSDRIVVTGMRPTEAILSVVGNASVPMIYGHQGRYDIKGGVISQFSLGEGELIQTGGTLIVVDLWGGRFTFKQGTAQTVMVIGPGAVIDLTQVSGELDSNGLNFYRGGFSRTGTLNLAGNPIPVNYHTPGDHGQPVGTMTQWG